MFIFDLSQKTQYIVNFVVPIDYALIKKNGRDKSSLDSVKEPFKLQEFIRIHIIAYV